MQEQKYERQMKPQEESKENLQQGSITSKLNPLLKEYTCRVFDQLLASQYTYVQSQVCITFNKSNPTKLLPKYYQDKTCDRFYVLKWKYIVKNQTESKICLQILQILGGSNHNLKNQGLNPDTKLNQRIWKFQFSHEPQDIAIVTDNIYFVAGNQLISFKLNKYIAGQPKNVFTSQKLSYKKVEQIYGFLWNGQQGAIFYLRDENNNLFTRQVINNQLKMISWDQNLNELTSKLYFGVKKIAKKELLKSCFFQVLIPKVLGLCFESQNQFYLLNLSTLQQIPNTRKNLTQWSLVIPQRTKVALKSIHNKKSKNRFCRSPQNPQAYYDDILMICIGQKDHFQQFKLCLKLKQNVSIDPYSQYYALEILEQKIIQWSQCSFQSFLVVYHNFNSIQDLEYVKDGLILHGIENPLSRISNYCFYHKNEQFGTSFNILTHQVPIWNSFLNRQINIIKQSNSQFQDQEITQSQVYNSVFKANKFTVPFILNFLAKGTQKNVSTLQKDDFDIKKLTFQWARTFKTVKIIEFKGQIFLIRQHSLSVLTPIEPFQFKLQNSRAERLYKMLSYQENPQTFKNKKASEYEFNDSQSQFSFDDDLSRISIDDAKRLYHINFKDTYSRQNIEIAQIVSVFIGIQKSLIKYTQYLQSKDDFTDSVINQQAEQDNQKFQSANWFPFPNYYAEVISNRVRDLIEFFNKFLIKYEQIFEFNCQLDKNSPLEVFNKEFKRFFNQYRPISAAFKFYSQLACNDLKTQHSNYLQDIFTKFIKQKSELQDQRIFKGDINSDSSLIIGRLFQSLIPNFKEEKPAMFWFDQISFKKRNQFLQMLINLSKGAYNRREDQLSKKYLNLFIEIFMNKQYFPLNLSSLSATAITKHERNASLYGSLISNFFNVSRQQLYEILQLLPLLSAQGFNYKENQKLLCKILHPVFPQCEMMIGNSKNPKNGKKVVKNVLKDCLLPSKQEIFMYKQFKDIMLNTSQIQLDQIIHNINKKLVEKKETTKLMEFWVSVFRLRCYSFKHRGVMSQILEKQQLLSLLDKCKVAFISFKTYFFQIYPYGDKFKAQVVPNQNQIQSLRSNQLQKYLDDLEWENIADQWLLNSQFVPCKIEIMGKLATIRWINLLKVSLQADLDPMSFKVDQNNQVDIQNQFTVDFIEKIGNFLFVQSMKRKSILLLKRVIQIYGIYNISVWINSEEKALRDYNNTSDQFKSYLKYSKVNCQYSEKLQSIAKNMKYRSAYSQKLQQTLTEIRNDELQNQNLQRKTDFRNRRY